MSYSRQITYKYYEEEYQAFSFIMIAGIRFPDRKWPGNAKTNQHYHLKNAHLFNIHMENVRYEANVTQSKYGRSNNPAGLDIL